MKTLLILLSTVTCALSIPAAFAGTTVPGGVYTAALPPGAHSVRYDGKPVLLVNGRAVIGVPMSAALGAAHIDYIVDEEPQRHRFSIEHKAYTEQHITLQNQNMVDPPAETLKRIRDEAIRQRRLYNSHTDQVDLADGFILPLQGITTSLFGHKRFFNGQPRNPHSGLDIAADAGTPIAAAGPGTVRLADELYFNGKTLFIDHGQGLITMYCHMSELLVSEGDEIAQGQPIGLVGATGRATGPHLHWSVSLNGTRVDPTGFMQALNDIVGRSESAAP